MVGKFDPLRYAVMLESLSYCIMLDLFYRFREFQLPPDNAITIFSSKRRKISAGDIVVVIDARREYIATMFFGVQFESIDYRKLKVIELAA